MYVLTNAMLTSSITKADLFPCFNHFLSKQKTVDSISFYFLNLKNDIVHARQFYWV